MLGGDRGEDCCAGRQGRRIGQLRRLRWPDLGVKRLGASGRRTRRRRCCGAGRRTERGQCYGAGRPRAGRRTGRGPLRTATDGAVEAGGARTDGAAAAVLAGRGGGRGADGAAVRAGRRGRTGADGRGCRGGAGRSGRRGVDGAAVLGGERDAFRGEIVCRARRPCDVSSRRGELQSPG